MAVHWDTFCSSLRNQNGLYRTWEEVECSWSHFTGEKWSRRKLNDWRRAAVWGETSLFATKPVLPPRAALPLFYLKQCGIASNMAERKATNIAAASLQLHLAIGRKPLPQTTVVHSLGQALSAIFMKNPFVKCSCRVPVPTGSKGDIFSDPIYY